MIADSHSTRVRIDSSSALGILEEVEDCPLLLIQEISHLQHLVIRVSTIPVIDILEQPSALSVPNPLRGQLLSTPPGSILGTMLFVTL
jgi:hypothetical protein